MFLTNNISKIKIKFTCIAILFTFFLSNQKSFAYPSVNGRFQVISQDSLHYIIELQINTNTSPDTLGCSTIIFNFDSSSISFPALPLKDVDYEFINFQDANYNSTITRPLPNQIWINIESLFSNKGTIVAQSPAWTNIAKLSFSIRKANGSSKLIWQTNNANWAIYGLDNTNIWENEIWSNENSIFTADGITNGYQDDMIPNKFNLFQNFPNPFNPSTTIKFSIPFHSHVSILLYDILGKKLRVLLDEDKLAGTYSINFKAENMSSGIYMYGIICGDYTRFKKMILLK